jgi:glycosyltransferase involved in cell wall biosynthesis
MISTFYPPYNFGGDGIFIHRLSNALARRGHHVDVIHCQDAYLALAGSPPAGRYDDHPNVTVHGLKSAVGILSPLATQQTGYPLFKAARIRAVLNRGFDVINYHNISLVGGPKILEYGRAVKLYTLHEFWLVCPTHLLFKFNRSVCERPSCFACTLVHKRPPALWRYTGLLKAQVRHVDAFISPDRHTMAKHREFGLDLPLVHLPHFVPLEEAVRPEHRGNDDDLRGRPYFLFVGRLERIKGLHTLIPLFREFTRARLLVAGDGTDAADLRRAAQGCANIEFLGYQSGSRLDALYRNAVAVVVPSLTYEVAPPLVIMEAFLRRTPAIVRALGSMPESIEESGGGLVYDTDHALLAAMERLLDDRVCRDMLGDKGYEAYRTKWTTEAYLERYLGLIERLSASQSARTIAGLSDR